MPWDGINVPEGYFLLKRDAVAAYEAQHPVERAFKGVSGRTIRAAEGAGGALAATAVRAAVKAAPKIVAAAGGARAVAGALIESGGLLTAGAIAGWLIGQDIARSLSGENREEREVAAALDRVHAVARLRQQLGRQPTLEEQKIITDAYNRRLKLIRQGLPA